MGGYSRAHAPVRSIMSDLVALSSNCGGPDHFFSVHFSLSTARDRRTLEIDQRSVATYAACSTRSKM
jgi:hypothetical protein